MASDPLNLQQGTTIRGKLRAKEVSAIMNAEEW
jgi:hypothetical protein